MSIRVRKIACLTGFLTFGNLCAAQETLSTNKEPATKSGGDPGTVVQIRGRDSIVEQLNMGPNATEFWRKLQVLISHPEMLEDFSSIVGLFGLTVKERLDLITPNTPAPASRNDTSDEKYFSATNIMYGISVGDQEKNSRVVRFSMAMNSSQICLSAQEVRRAYGLGRLYVAGHGNVPPDVRIDPTGFWFEEVYGSSDADTEIFPLIFSYSGSGCMRSVTLQRVMNQH